jgi:MFS family permease
MTDCSIGVCSEILRTRGLALCRCAVGHDRDGHPGVLCSGVLPNYSQIGIWAPVLLVVFRFVQGFALGGEWGSAALMSVE